MRAVRTRMRKLPIPRIPQRGISGNSISVHARLHDSPFLSPFRLTVKTHPDPRVVGHDRRRHGIDARWWRTASCAHGDNETKDQGPSEHWMRGRLIPGGIDSVSPAALSRRTPPAPAEAADCSTPKHAGPARPSAAPLGPVGPAPWPRRAVRMEHSPDSAGPLPPRFARVMAGSGREIAVRWESKARE
jgi:hypothetical protein